MSQKEFKPNLSHSQASEMATRLYRLTPTVIRPLPSYDDQNFYLAAIEGGEYVLKIMNTEDSKNTALMEVQTHAMTFLHQHGLPVQTVLPTTTGQWMSLEEIDCGFGCRKYLVRLLTYLPGITISKVSVSSQLLYETGKTAAKMNKLFQEMEHPQLSALQREYRWNLSHVPMMDNYIHLMDGEPVQEVIKSVIQYYKTYVVPEHSNFNKCINHGDINNFNLLVQPDENNGYRISGILDFGDMSNGYYIYELAIIIMYMMLDHPKPMEVGGPVLAGWESVIPLNEAERNALYPLVLSRFCQSLVYARHAVSLCPENEDYLMSTSKVGIPMLSHLWELGKEKVERVWFQSAAQYCDRK